MIISGKNSVNEALLAGKGVTKVMICNTTKDEFSRNIVDICKSRHIRFDFVPRIMLDRLAEHHQGYVAEVTDYEYCSLDDILTGERGDRLVVLLDNIEDVHNFGSIIRVCDCAGVGGVIIPERRSVAVSETVYKTSAGAVSHVKIARVVNLNDTIRTLKKEGFFVFGAEAGGESVYRTNLTGDVGIVMGSEGKGLSDLTQKLCDGIISLPMLGHVNSLNVATATSAIVYEALRQRNK